MAGRHQRHNQSSITTTLIIPDSKPDVERILRVTSMPEVKRISVIKGKVVVTGELVIQVEYVALCGCNTQPVHFASFRVATTIFVDHPCAQPCKEANLVLSVEFQEAELLNRRTINVFIILKAVIRKLDHSRLLIRPQVTSPVDNACAADSGLKCPSACRVIECANGESGSVNCDLEC